MALKPRQSLKNPESCGGMHACRRRASCAVYAVKWLQPANFHRCLCQLCLKALHGSGMDRAAVDDYFPPDLALTDASSAAGDGRAASAAATLLCCSVARCSRAPALSATTSVRACFCAASSRDLCAAKKDCIMRRTSFRTCKLKSSPSYVAGHRGLLQSGSPASLVCLHSGSCQGSFGC